MSEVDKCVNDCDTPIPDGGVWGYCDNCWNYGYVEATNDPRNKAPEFPTMDKDVKTLCELDKLVRRLYGEECDVYDEGCPTCEAWKFVTELGELAMESWKVKNDELRR